ncbi:MAG TPA: hypothetical protein VLI40_08990, partial [Gemmatimonadaceae bacterium]|nr:hypothetical protein [Gemmatimonadaceae bacterium]
MRLAPKDALAGARVRERDIFQRLDAPPTIPLREYCQDQRVDVVRASRMRWPNPQPAPEVNDR